MNPTTWTYASPRGAGNRSAFSREARRLRAERRAWERPWVQYLRTLP